MLSMYWEDHSVDVMRLVGDFYKNEEFTDCALDTEGGLIHGHKTLLAACSPFLQKLFRDHRGMKIIPLKEVNHKDMKQILDFIYCGQIYVPVTDMGSLRQSAELLQISSLQSAFPNFLETFSSNDIDEGGETRFGQNFMKRVERETYVHENRCIGSQDVHQNSELGFFTSCQNIHQQSSGCGTKPCIDTKSLSKEAIEDQSDISSTNTRVIKMDTVNNDRETVQDELPPLTFVCVKSEDLSNQESESCEDVGDLESESCEGNMFLATEPMGDIQSNQNIKPYRAVSNFCFEDYNLEKSQDLEYKFESICEPDLKEKKPCLAGLEMENTEEGDEPFSLKLGNEESSIVSMQDVNCELGVTTTAFNETFGSPMLQKVSSKLQKELRTCSENEETFNSSLIDPIFSPKVKCEHIPSHTANEVHFGCGNTHLKPDGHLISEKSSCHECDASFRHQSVFKKHMRYTDEKPFKCGECRASFKDSSTLRRHVRTHTGEKPFKCGECRASFIDSSTMRRHERTHTGEKPFKCGECKASFRDSSNLRVHERTHTGEKPFKCGECDASFSHNHTLKNHIRSHTGEKPFKCEECDVSFLRKERLIIHKRIHTGEKPFKCGVCDVSFNRKSILKIHLTIHTGEKPFKCGECDASFRYKTNLKTHIRSHTGEKPFKCEECDVSFRHKKTLKNHIRSHTGEKPL